MLSYQQISSEISRLLAQAYPDYGAMVRSWIMIEAVIYGVTFNANNDIDSNDPPVKEFNRLKESPNKEFKYWLIVSVSIPGIGS